MARTSLALAIVVVLSATTLAAAPHQVVAAPEPDNLADKQCPTPSNLTGPSLVLTNSFADVGTVPSVVWDGAAYGIAFRRSITSDLSFARYAADGTPLVPATTISVSDGRACSLVFTGTEYAAAYDDTANIRFCRIYLTGGMIGPSDVVVSGGGGIKVNASLVWNGTSFGVAWQDLRDGNYDIFFNRLSAQGVVSAPGADTRVTDTPSTSSQTEPSLAWMGSEYAVVWTDDRNVNFEIYGNRVSSVGVRLGSDIRLTSDAAISARPTLAWGGSAYGLAWDDSRTTASDVYFALLDRSLVKLTPTDVQLTNNAGSTSHPSIVWTGAEYGIGWVDGTTGDVWLSRVTSGGVATGSDVQITDEAISIIGLGNTGLAFGTLGYGVAYALSDTATAQIHFVGIACRADTTPPTCPTGLTVTGNSAAGVTLSWAAPGVDPETELAYHRIYRDGSPIGITTEAVYTDAPRPAGSPLYTVVAVNAAGRESTGCAVVSAPLPTGGCGQDLTGSQFVTASSSSATDPSIAWTGNAFAVAWSDNRDANTEIYFRRMSTSGAALGSDVRVTTMPFSSLRPRLAWTGSELAVAWSDSRDGNSELYFARLDPAGTKIGADVRITTDPLSSGSSGLSLVWAGSELGAAWADDRFSAGQNEILFTRISSAGVKIVSDVRLTSDAANSSEPSLVWSGLEYAVAWHDNRPGNYEVYFTRVSADGVKQGSDVRITSDPAGSFTPRLAFSGSTYATVWEEQRDGPPNQEVYFARISTTGSKLGSDVRLTFDNGSSTNHRIFWTGSEYGVTWADNRAGNNNYEMYYAMVGENGVKSGGDQRLTFAPTFDVSPDTAVSGRGIGLVYQVDAAADQLRFMGLGCGALDTTPPSCPTSPQELSRTPGNPGTVTLGWGPSIDPESDLSHYRVFKDGLEIANTLALTYTDASFDPAAGPTYWVDAMNAASLVSPACGSIDTSDAVPPTCPTNLIATDVTPSSCNLWWIAATDGRSGMRRYHVYKNNVLETTVAHPATMASISGLTGGTTYNFAVVAEDWAGNLSGSCANATVWISTAPITLHVTKNPNAIDAHLDWNDAGLSEYVIFRSTSPSWSSEHARVPISEDEDAVLQDGVQLWYYYIQQRGL